MLRVKARVKVDLDTCADTLLYLYTQRQQGHIVFYSQAKLLRLTPTDMRICADMRKLEIECLCSPARLIRCLKFDSF